VLVDANILLYATDRDSPFHDAAKVWLEEALNGVRRVGLPWSSTVAFARIATHARALRTPLTPAAAWDLVEAWLAAPAAWVPMPGDAHAEILGRLVRDLDLRGNLIADAAVAALCIEHGLDVVSADTDFARFTEITWVNPIAR